MAQYTPHRSGGLQQPVADVVPEHGQALIWDAPSQTWMPGESSGGMPFMSLISNYQTNSPTWVVVTQLGLSDSDFSSPPKLFVTGRTSSADCTLEVRFYNLTDQIELAVVSTASTDPVSILSDPFQLAAGQKVYEVHVRRVGTGSDRIAYASYAGLRY